MAFPETRLRRVRQHPLVRPRLTQVSVGSHRLIAPLFIRPGKGVRAPVASMPGVEQLSVDEMLREAALLRRQGVTAVLLFGLPVHKDLLGKDAYASQGIVQKAVRALKTVFPETLVITDLCFCEYTTHGHCGVMREGHLDNDATLKLIAKTAVVQARAGADIIAPSGMVDGMVRTIRRALDLAGFQKTLIMSYAAKYASAFYGPFRDAAGSAPQYGDRRGYQMDPANSDEALREVKLDIEEGADIVMVKPALAYLDIIRRVKDEFHVPVAAYNVSGEYSMVKAAGGKGWVDEARIIQEILTSIRRAGADWIITYHAKDVAEDQRAAFRNGSTPKGRHPQKAARGPRLV